MSLIGHSTSQLSGDVVTPSDKSVFDSNNGRLWINNVDGYRQRHFGAIAAFNPLWPIRDTTGAIELLGSTIDTTTATLPYLGADSQNRFAIIPDPDNSAKKCYQMVVKQGDPLTVGAPRIEISTGNTSTRLTRGKRIWISFGVRVPSSWKSWATNDEALIFQIQTTPDGYDIGTQNPNFAMIIKGGGSNPSVSSLEFTTRYNADDPTDKALNIGRTVFKENNWAGDTWQIYVIETVLHWDAAKKPYMKIWRQQNNQVVQIVDDQLPNQYNQVLDDYLKHGIYYYQNLWSNGQTVKEIHSKGVHCWKDNPGLSLDSILQYMNRI